MGLLHDRGLAGVYEQDVFGLNPLLIAMGQRGMPVDEAKRREAAEALSEQRLQILDNLNTLIPDACKPVKVWKKKRKEWGDVPPTTITIERRSVTKRATKKLPERSVGVAVYHERLAFNPSPKQLQRYMRYQNYPLPKRTDRFSGQSKVSLDEAAVRRLALKYEDDRVWVLVLQYRETDKLLSTYLGRPS